MRKEKYEKGVSISMTIATLKYDKYLEEKGRLKQNIDLSTKDEMLALGEKYYNDGINIDDVDLKIKGNHFFVTGYEIGKRKALIRKK